MSTVNNEGNLIFDFVEENGQKAYVAEFKATGPFSLHIERKESGRITVYQKSYENGKYATVKNVDIAPQDTIIDAEVPGGVFPKWIKIKSSSEVEVAEVSFEDEQSGGGAGAAKYMPKYYSVKLSSELNFDDFKTGLGGIALMKINFYETIMILGGYAGSIMFQETPYNEVIAIAFMPVQEMGVLLNTFEEYVAKSTWKDSVEYTEITEEQFYNLEA